MSTPTADIFQYWTICNNRRAEEVSWCIRRGTVVAAERVGFVMDGPPQAEIRREGPKRNNRSRVTVLAVFSQLDPARTHEFERLAREAEMDAMREWHEQKQRNAKA